MKWVKRVLIWGGAGFLALLLVLWLGGYAIDPAIELSTEAELSAPPERLFALSSSTDGVRDWWKDAGKQPDGDGGHPPMDVVALDGPTSGPGTKLAFKAGETVMETWTLSSVDAPRKVVWEVDFAGMMTVERTLNLTAGEGGKTKVTWRETGSIDNPLMRWFKVMMPAESAVANFQLALKLMGRAAEAQDGASSRK